MNIKLDKSLKDDAQNLADELGIPLSTIMVASLKEIVRNRSVTMSALPRLKPAIEAELKAAIEDSRKNKNITKSYTDPQEMAIYLKNL